MWTIPQPTTTSGSRKMSNPTPIMMDEPAAGSRWRHHSGRLYTVLFLTNGLDRPDYPRTVVYVGAVNGQIWSGPLHDWHRRMTEIPHDE